MLFVGDNVDKMLEKLLLFFVVLIEIILDLSLVPVGLQTLRRDHGPSIDGGVQVIKPWSIMHLEKQRTIFMPHFRAMRITYDNLSSKRSSVMKAKTNQEKSGRLEATGARIGAKNKSRGYSNRQLLKERKQRTNESH